MNTINPQNWKADLPAFREKTAAFYAGEIKVGEYKGFSGYYGSYAQKGGKASMLRLRMPAGRVTRDKLAFVAQMIRTYAVARAHFTTCQTIQLHDLDPDTVCAIMEQALDAGIVTMGGGGDFPRNVMASPLSGVQIDEAFDVMPYAKAAADFLMPFIYRVKLPRKLKVCFSNSAQNLTHATFRDLGFIANADHTFDVYSAGGLGNNPKMGVCVAKGIAPEKILYYIKAMIDTFTAYGNYQVRGRARTRYMQDTLGTEGYKKAYLEKLEEVFKNESLDLHVTPKVISKTGTSKDFTHPRVTAQKQPGLYAVFYQPIGGNPDPLLLCRLAEVISSMPDVVIRLTPSQGMYFINCTQDEALRLIEMTGDSAKTLFETSVACIGNAICQVGARDSQAMLKACIDAVRPENFADGVLPQIHISGCPSSCSAHQIGAIAFRGGVKQTPEGPKPAFAMYAGGCETQGHESFGRELGIVAADGIPKLLVELGRTIAVENTTYDQWIKTNIRTLEAIAAKYI